MLPFRNMQPGPPVERQTSARAVQMHLQNIAPSGRFSVVPLGHWSRAPFSSHWACTCKCRVNEETFARHLFVKNINQVLSPMTGGKQLQCWSNILHWGAKYCRKICAGKHESYRPLLLPVPVYDNQWNRPSYWHFRQLSDLLTDMLQN